MYRKTYAKIDGDILKNNVKEIIKKHNDYKYYFGVVKNNAYNHGMYIVNDLIESGINYLAVSSFEEALNIRKYNTEIPILCLEPIDIEYIYDCINNNVTITVESINYINDLIELKLKDTIKIHLKIDSGMSRLGFSSKKEINNAVDLLNKEEKLELEGIYSHFATSGISDQYWDLQLEKFKYLTSDIELNKIPIVHLGRSQTLINHDRIPFTNGIRLGIIMYGSVFEYPEGNFLRKAKRNHIIKKYDISETHLKSDLNLKYAFSLYSTVMSVRKINAGDFVGYGAHFIATEETYIATIPAGYADGVTKMFKYVSINNSLYEIVADSMDMIMVKVDKNIKIGMDVEIFGNKITVKECLNNTKLSSYQLFNNISNRVPRVHYSNDVKQEIKY